MTTTIARTHSTTECDVCGKALPKGGEHALVVDRKLCGLCAVMLLGGPLKSAAPEAVSTVADCVAAVDSGLCDAACILSSSDVDGCGCRCGGEYHGALRRLLEEFADDTPANAPPAM